MGRSYSANLLIYAALLSIFAMPTPVWASEASEKAAIGNRLAAEGFYEDAIIFYNKALQIDPGYFPASQARANCLRRLHGEAKPAVKKPKKPKKPQPQTVQTAAPASAVPTPAVPTPAVPTPAVLTPTVKEQVESLPESTAVSPTVTQPSLSKELDALPPPTVPAQGASGIHVWQVVLALGSLGIFIGLIIHWLSPRYFQAKNDKLALQRAARRSHTNLKSMKAE